MQLLIIYGCLVQQFGFCTHVDAIFHNLLSKLPRTKKKNLLSKRFSYAFLPGSFFSLSHHTYKILNIFGSAVSMWLLMVLFFIFLNQILPGHIIKKIV
jgi:hypothetical protein